MGNRSFRLSAAVLAAGLSPAVRAQTPAPPPVQESLAALRAHAEALAPDVDELSRLSLEEARLPRLRLLITQSAAEALAASSIAAEVAVEAGRSAEGMDADCRSEGGADARLAAAEAAVRAPRPRWQALTDAAAKCVKTDESCRRAADLLAGAGALLDESDAGLEDMGSRRATMKESLFYGQEERQSLEKAAQAAAGQADAIKSGAPEAMALAEALAGASDNAVKDRLRPKLDALTLAGRGVVEAAGTVGKRWEDLDYRREAFRKAFKDFARLARSLPGRAAEASRRLSDAEALLPR